MRGMVIRGVGSSLPAQRLTNVDLESMMETTDDWIADRTGIRERRIGGSTSDMAIEASRIAIERSGIDPATIELVVLSTTTPDQQVPATAPTVQDALGLTCGAIDVNAACSGFTYGLIASAGMIALGSGPVLVVGSDALSRITDYHDRSTGILFADGAGAAVVTPVDGPGSLLGWDLGTDGSARGILYAEIGSVLKMDGKEVFRRAVRVMAASAQNAMRRAGVTIDDIALCIPHQANIRIIDAAIQRLGIPMERTVTNLDRVGNTSSGSIPLALDEAVQQGRIADGDLVLVCGFGAGMTWASCVLRWGAA